MVKTRLTGRSKAEAWVPRSIKESESTNKRNNEGSENPIVDKCFL